MVSRVQGPFSEDKTGQKMTKDTKKEKEPVRTDRGIILLQRKIPAEPGIEPGRNSSQKILLSLRQAVKYLK